MKKIYKDNKLFFLILGLLLLIAFYIAIKYGVEYLKLLSDYRNAKELYPDNINLNWDMKMSDAFSIYTDSILTFPLRLLLPLSSLIIILASTYGIYNYFNSGMWKNILIRTNYKKEMRKQITKTYLYSLVLPIFIILFLIILTITTRNIDVISTLKNNPDSIGIGTEHFHNWSTFFIFLFVYILDLVFWGIFYVNIFLIFLRKNMPYLVLVLVSFLTILGIGVIAETFVGAIFYYKLGYSVKIIYSLSIFNSLTLNQIYNMWYYLLYGFLYFYISTIFVYFIYRNKKRIVMRNEN